MTDRFSTQLRKHLVETADERPAEGQLAAVVQGVARTQQRHPVVARLGWIPGRIGPVPTVVLRYGLLAASLALAMVGGAMLAGGQDEPTTAFEGAWITIDPADGSGMTLVVGPGQTPPVYFEDGYASGAACVGDAVRRFTARGTGQISGDRMVATFPDGGGCGRTTVAVEVAVDHDPRRDTLTDQDGVVWTRALGEATQPPVTQAPPQDQPPQDQPTQDQPTEEPPTAEPPAATNPLETDPVATSAASDPGPTCFDVPAGTTYTRSVDERSLTMAIPAAAAFSWQGNRDYFGLGDNCNSGGPVVVLASMVELVFGSCGHTAGRPPSAAIAVEWLTETEDFTTSEPTELTIDGHPATRFEVSFDTSPCPDEFEAWDGSGLDRSSAAIVYIVDVEANDVPLGITILNRGGEAPAAQVAEADAIVASLQIEP